MDLNALPTFVQVARHQSFTQAADALRVPKSTVSLKISTLEADLGLTLFRRTTRRVELTEAGRELYQQVAGLLENLDLLGQNLTEKNQALRGIIRLTTTEEMGTHLLSPILARFLNQYPEIHLVIDLGTEVRDLVTGPYDLAIRAGQLDDSSLKSIRLGTSVLQFFSSPSFEKQTGTYTSLDHVQKQGWYSSIDEGPIVLSKNSGHHRQTLKMTPSPRLQVQNVMALKAFAVHGGGICLLPKVFCQKEIEQKRLIPILPEWSTPDSPFHLLYSPHRNLPERIRVLIRFLQEHLSVALS